jgi:hypothetical protein
MRKEILIRTALSFTVFTLTLISSSIFFMLFYRKGKSESSNQNLTPSSLSSAKEYETDIRDLPKEYETEIREFLEFKHVLQELGIPKLEKVIKLSKAEKVLYKFLIHTPELDKVEVIKKQVSNLKGNDPSQISLALTFFKCIFSISYLKDIKIKDLDIVPLFKELFENGSDQKNPDNISIQAGYNLALIALKGSKELMSYLNQHRDLISSHSFYEDLIRIVDIRFNSLFGDSIIEFVEIGAIDLIGNLFLKVVNNDKSDENIAKMTARIFSRTVTVRDFDFSQKGVWITSESEEEAKYVVLDISAFEVIYAVLDKLFQFSDDEKAIGYTIDISKAMIPSFRNWNGKADLDQLIGNIYKHLSNLLHSKSSKIFDKVLFAFTILASKGVVEAESAINTDLLKVFNEIQGEISQWTYLRYISEISALSSPHLQSNIDPKFYSYLKTMAVKDISNDAIEDAAIALSNATRNYAMKPDEIESLVNQGIVEFFKDCITTHRSLWNSGHFDILRVLRSLYEILEAGKLKLPKDSTDENPYAKLFIELEIPVVIKEFLDDQRYDDEIVDMAKKIKSFFPK